METVTVRFENVGPSKMCWSEALPSPLTVHSLTRSIKKRHALGSRDIEFSEEREDCWGGTIFVGLFRPVGSWRVIDAKPATGL